MSHRRLYFIILKTDSEVFSRTSHDILKRERDREACFLHDYYYINQSSLYITVAVPKWCLSNVNRLMGTVLI